MTRTARTTARLLFLTLALATGLARPAATLFTHTAAPALQASEDEPTRPTGG